MSARNSDRNLLFGILALQIDFITRDALIQAMNDWVLNKEKPIGEILVENQHLSSQNRNLLEQMVDAHVEAHAGVPERSLAAISSVDSIRDDLEKIDATEIAESLSHLPPATPRASTESTVTFVGSSPDVGDYSSLDNRFRIIRPHAEGGLGKVSVAMDKELNREVALKEIKERLANDESARARFTMEAEITGGLEHPGIVPVYGLGHRDDGQPFYAMRFIKGDSLKDASAKFHQGKEKRTASENAIEFRKLLARFIDVCDAIEYAHSRGVLHRDLKPGNIMLGKYGETLVVDWGLAKAIGRDEIYKDLDESTLQPSASGSTPATQLGSALGTPHFMSPEQAAGKLDKLGPASDVYSLGATLYCLLVNRSPFAEGSPEAILAKAQKGEFAKPRELDPAVPKPLEAICLKAMHREASRRYPSPRDLANDIERWLADESIHAWQEPLSVKAKRWFKKHPKTVSSMVAALIIGTTAAVLISFVIAERNRSISRALGEAIAAKSAESTAKNEAESARGEAVQAKVIAERARNVAEEERDKHRRWLSNVAARLRGIVGRKPPSVVFVLDASGSMSIAESASADLEVPRLEIAKRFLLMLFEELRGFKFNVGLRVFGHRARYELDSDNKPVIVFRNRDVEGIVPENDVELIQPLSMLTSNTEVEVLRRIQDIIGWGQTPLHLALCQAAEDFRLDPPGNRRLIVAIIDGVNYSIPVEGKEFVRTIGDCRSACREASAELWLFFLESGSMRTSDNPAELEANLASLEGLAAETGGRLIRIPAREQSGDVLLRYFREAMRLGDWDRTEPYGSIADSKIEYHDDEIHASISVAANDPQSGILAVELRLANDPRNEWIAATYQSGNVWQGHMVIPSEDATIEVQITNNVGLHSVVSHRFELR